MTSPREKLTNTRNTVSLSNLSHCIISSWCQSEEHLFPWVPHMHKRFGTSGFFQSFLTPCHSPLTGRPTTSSNGGVTRRLYTFFFFLLSFFPLSIPKKLASHSLYNLHLPYQVTRPPPSNFQSIQEQQDMRRNETNSKATFSSGLLLMDTPVFTD